MKMSWIAWLAGAALAFSGLGRVAWAAEAKPDSDGLVRIEIDSAKLKGYPAALVSLDEHRITMVPATREELQKLEIVADLWIEPRDPELGGLPEKFEGTTHKGQDTKVAVVTGVTFDELSRVPDGVSWKQGLARKEIRQGTVFLVQSSTGKLYKVRLDTVSRDKKETSRSVIVMAYRQIAPTRDAPR